MVVKCFHQSISQNEPHIRSTVYPALCGYQSLLATLPDNFLSSGILIIEGTVDDNVNYMGNKSCITGTHVGEIQNKETMNYINNA